MSDTLLWIDSFQRIKMDLRGVLYISESWFTTIKSISNCLTGVLPTVSSRKN